MTSNGKSSFSLLCQEAKDLYLPHSVNTMHDIPDPMQFLRQYVSKNIPLLIKGGARKWPAMKKWDRTYLKKVLNNKQVTVAVTPNGYADAIATKLVDGVEKEFFVVPEERSMALSEFFAHLENVSRSNDISAKNPAGVFYLQKQNSNLSEDFPELLNDIDPTLQWASDAFGEEPTAINLWIGDKRSVTSLHKDPFENVYCVVRGWKDFILLPPTDRPWIPYKTLPIASYCEKSPGIFQIDDSTKDHPTAKIPWIAIDPLNPDLVSYPEYSNASPLHVRVGPGDLLYLPSLWFHHVRQSDGCIAVNHWYDMALDIKFAYYQFLEDLVNKSKS